MVKTNLEFKLIVQIPNKSFYEMKIYKRRFIRRILFLFKKKKIQEQNVSNVIKYVAIYINLRKNNAL